MSEFIGNISCSKSMPLKKILDKYAKFYNVKIKFEIIESEEQYFCTLTGSGENYNIHFFEKALEALKD